MSTFWLALDAASYNNRVDFSQNDDFGDSQVRLVIPVVSIQTGASRSSLTAGIFRQPRIRPPADKFGTPTTLTGAKELSFSALVQDRSMDLINQKWGVIQSFLDRAQLSSSRFPRGTGVVFVEQFNDAGMQTVWDVTSGVLTDVDMNQPDLNAVAAVVQLSVLPFSRGVAQTVAYGPVVSNGPGSKLWVPYPGGDGPGLWELRLKDRSAQGHFISWVGVGRRWFPDMSSNDFTPWYSEAGSITTSQDWQQILARPSDPGNHQTGLLGVYAVVNDASPVIGQPTDVALTPNIGAASLPNGDLTVVLAPRNGSGVEGQPSSRITATIDNPNQPGNVQDYEGFEGGNWNSFAQLPTQIIPGSGSVAIGIDATAAIAGTLGAHFKVTGDSTAGSVTSGAVSRFMQPLSGLQIQSIAFKIKPVSWGGSVSSSGGVADPTAAPTVTPHIGAPGTVFRGTIKFGYTWTTASGETGISPLTTLTLGSSYALIDITIPSFPATVTGARVFASQENPPGSSAGAGDSPTFDFGVSTPGTYDITQLGDGVNAPPSSNTTGTPLSHDATARFTWGSLSLVTAGPANTFAAFVGAVQIGSAFTLTPGVVHQIGANFKLVGTMCVYSLIVDNALIGSHADALVNLSIPITAGWACIGAGTGGPYTEEYYLDQIYVYDAILEPGFHTEGSSVDVSARAGANTATLDLYYSLRVTGTTTVSWYRLSSAALPLTITTPVMPGAVLVAGPPSVAPSVSYAQLQARIGMGHAPVRFLNKNVVRTRKAGGVDELVRLGSMELPPGSKAEGRLLDGWTFTVWGKSGADNTDLLTVKGLVLFPEDEDGWTGITAKALGVSAISPGAIPNTAQANAFLPNQASATGPIWHIGTNRYGEPYAQLFQGDDVTMIGSADVDGAIGTEAGNQTMVVLTGTLDADGNVICDLAQQFQLGYKVAARWHFEATELAAV